MYALPSAPVAIAAPGPAPRENARSCWVFTAFVSTYVDAEAAAEEVETIGSDSKYCVVLFPFRRRDSEELRRTH